MGVNSGQKRPIRQGILKGKPEKLEIKFQIDNAFISSSILLALLRASSKEVAMFALPIVNTNLDFLSSSITCSLVTPDKIIFELRFSVSLHTSIKTRIPVASMIGTCRIRI